MLFIVFPATKTRLVMALFFLLSINRENNIENREMFLNRKITKPPSLFS